MKLMARRLEPLMPFLVHLDQMGFIGVGQGGRTCVEPSWCWMRPESFLRTLLISLYAEVFDRLKWPFLQATLKKMAFPAKLMAPTNMQTGPFSRVKTNGILSGSFKLQSGTRQGCPLSPFNFDLGIEPLAEKIQTRERFRGVRVDGVDNLISLFADEVLLYV